MNPAVARIMEVMDNAAFEELLLSHRAIAVKVASIFCRDADDRRELAQDICAEVWRASSSYDPQRRFSTWMYRIALNVAISHRRRAVQRDRYVTTSEPRLLDALPGRALNESDDRVRVLHQLIEGLDDLHRALVLLYLDGYRHHEIGEVLGITETNVATKLNRIKEHLRGQVLEGRHGAR
jgi:RNA polymerase sigma-70 factor, ECF subfamily